MYCAIILILLYVFFARDTVLAKSMALRMVMSAIGKHWWMRLMGWWTLFVYIYICLSSLRSCVCVYVCAWDSIALYSCITPAELIESIAQ